MPCIIYLWATYLIANILGLSYVAKCWRYAGLIAICRHQARIRLQEGMHESSLDNNNNESISLATISDQSLNQEGGSVNNNNNDTTIEVSAEPISAESDDGLVAKFFITHEYVVTTKWMIKAFVVAFLIVCIIPSIINSSYTTYREHPTGQCEDRKPAELPTIGIMIASYIITLLVTLIVFRDSDIFIELRSQLKGEMFGYGILLVCFVFTPFINDELFKFTQIWGMVLPTVIGQGTLIARFYWRMYISKLFPSASSRTLSRVSTMSISENLEGGKDLKKTQKSKVSMQDIIMYKTSHLVNVSERTNAPGMKALFRCIDEIFDPVEYTLDNALYKYSILLTQHVICLVRAKNELEDRKEELKEKQTQLENNNNNQSNETTLALASDIEKLGQYVRQKEVTIASKILLQVWQQHLRTEFSDFQISGHSQEPSIYPVSSDRVDAIKKDKLCLIIPCWANCEGPYDFKVLDELLEALVSDLDVLKKCFLAGKYANEFAKEVGNQVAISQVNK